MIMGIPWTHLKSDWNPSGPLEVPYTPQTSYWSGTMFCRFLNQTGSSLLIFFSIEFGQTLELQKLNPKLFHFEDSAFLF